MQGQGARHKKKAAVTGCPTVKDLTILFVNCLGQFGTGLELSHFLSGNGNLLATGRINTLASRTLCNGKCTETYELYLLTSYQGSFYYIYCCIECLLGISLAQTSGLRDFSN